MANLAKRVAQYLWQKNATARSKFFKQKGTGMYSDWQAIRAHPIYFLEHHLIKQIRAQRRAAKLIKLVEAFAMAFELLDKTSATFISSIARGEKQLDTLTTQEIFAHTSLCADIEHEGNMDMTVEVLGPGAVKNLVMIVAHVVANYPLRTRLDNDENRRAVCCRHSIESGEGRQALVISIRPGQGEGVPKGIEFFTSLFRALAAFSNATAECNEQENEFTLRIPVRAIENS